MKNDRSPGDEPRNVASGVVLALTFLGIFTKHVHGFHRAKFAMPGAILMIIVSQYCGFFDSMQAVRAVDWNVVFLLGCMMAIVSIVIPTGRTMLRALRTVPVMAAPASCNCAAGSCSFSARSN